MELIQRDLNRDMEEQASKVAPGLKVGCFELLIGFTQ